jgi:hypothetical protein
MQTNRAGDRQTIRQEGLERDRQAADRQSGKQADETTDEL